MKKPGLSTVLFAAAFCMMVGVGAIVSILPRRILDLSADGISLGLLSTSFAVAYLAAQLPVGYLADRFGASAFLVGGYLVCAAAGLIFYLAPNAGVILVARIVQGIGEAPALSRQKAADRAVLEKLNATSRHILRVNSRIFRQ